MNFATCGGSSRVSLLPGRRRYCQKNGLTHGVRQHTSPRHRLYNDGFKPRRRCLPLRENATRPKDDGSPEPPKFLLSKIECADFTIGLLAVEDKAVVVLDKANSERDFWHRLFGWTGHGISPIFCGALGSAAATFGFRLDIKIFSARSALLLQIDPHLKSFVIAREISARNQPVFF